MVVIRCDLISVWPLSQPAFREELLRHFSLKSSLSIPYNRVLAKGYFAVREVKEDTLAKIDIYNKANWRVTYAYLDTT